MQIRSFQLAVATFFTPLLASLLPAAVFAGADAECLSSAVRSPLERSGNLDGLAAEWIRLLKEKPRDLSAELLARRLGAIRPGLLDEHALIEPIEELLMSDPAPTGIARQVLIDTLSDLYRRAGREEDRKRVGADRGFLTEWLIIGPFGKSAASLLEKPFPPEEDIKGDFDLSKGYRDAWQALRWRKVLRERVEPQIEPLEHIHPDDGIAYLLGQLCSDAERTVALHRGSTEGIRIWVNGSLIAHDDPRSAFLPSRRVTPVRLAKGWNRVLVKTRGGFWLRLSDPEGNPFPPGAITQEKEARLNPIGQFPNPLSAEAISPGALETWEAWIRELEDSSSNPQLLADALLGLAMLQDFYGRQDLSVRSVDRAVALAPEDPFVRFREGEVLRGARHYPQNVSKNRSRQAYELVLSKDPDFVPAYERLAGYLLDDDRYLEAIAKTREGLARAPHNLPLLLLLKTIYQRQRWKPQEMDVVREIERISPSSPIPPGFWGEFYADLRNAGKAVEFLRTAFERDRRQTQLLAEIARNVWSLDGAAAEAAIREAIALEPDEDRYRDLLIQILADRGRLEEATALARAEEARSPYDPGAAERLGELLLRAGDAQGSRAAYARALALEPGDLRLRRYLESTRAEGTGGPLPSGEPFWARYDERLEDHIPTIPQEGPIIEKAASLLVLDISVIRFEIDGSYSEFVHQAYKLLSEESKEDLARAPGGDEVFELRTISPTGEILEPVPAEGRRSFVMPGLVPGAFVEYAYRNDFSEVRGRLSDVRRFYFQDPSFKSPFLISRYVVIVPEGLDLAIVENRIPPEPGEKTRVPIGRVKKTVERLPSGETVLFYEARDSHRLEPEPMMPEPDEYLPNVEIFSKRTWSDIADELSDRQRGGTRISPELEDKAREIAGGIEDPLERAKAIYRFVNGLVANESGPREAVGVLLERAGDRNLLFKSLLDALKIPCHWAYLRPRDDYLPKMDWSVPRREAFGYPYLCLEIGGGDPVYVSLAQRGTPFGLLPEYLQGGKALLLQGGPARIVQVPSGSPERSATSTEGTLQVESGLALSIELQLISRAFAAFAQKDRLKTLPPFQKDLAVRATANRLFPGATVEVAELRGLEDPEAPFVVAIKAKAPRALERRGDDTLLKPVIQPAQLVRAFCAAPRREHPFHLRTQAAIRDKILVRPDSGRSIAALPADVTLANPLGTYSLSFRKDGEDVEIRRELTLLPGRLSTDEFPQFVEFCRKVDAAEGERLVLRERR